MSETEHGIIADEIQNLETALPAVKSDPNLGLHQEPHWQIFNDKVIRNKLQSLKNLKR